MRDAPDFSHLRASLVHHVKFPRSAAPQLRVPRPCKVAVVVGGERPDYGVAPEIHVVLDGHRRPRNGATVVCHQIPRKGDGLSYLHAGRDLLKRYDAFVLLCFRLLICRDPDAVRDAPGFSHLRASLVHHVKFPRSAAPQLRVPRPCKVAVVVGGERPDYGVAPEIHVVLDGHRRPRNGATVVCHQIPRKGDGLSYLHAGRDLIERYDAFVLLSVNHGRESEHARHKC